ASSAAIAPATTSNESSSAPAGRRIPTTDELHRSPIGHPLGSGRRNPAPRAALRPAQQMADEPSDHEEEHMTARLFRPGVLLATFALVATACGGSNATASPSGAARRPWPVARPDIAGPFRSGAANSVHGQWLDLAPLTQKTNYDLSGFPSNVVDIYKLDEGQVGIPFAIYPSALFYRKGLFEEANLDEPPHKYGDKYTLDGQPLDWNYDTIRQVAKRLTVDKNNTDATQ